MKSPAAERGEKKRGEERKEGEERKGNERREKKRMGMVEVVSKRIGGRGRGRQKRRMREGKRIEGGEGGVMVWRSIGGR